MANTLSLVNNFSLATLGNTVEGKQGLAASAFGTSLDLTSASTPAIVGTIHSLTGTLATASVLTAWASANSDPATFDYAWYWSDQISYIQLVTGATSSIHKVAATVPFVIPGYGSLLGAGSATIITGGSEPAVAALTKVVIGNYSGNTMNFQFACID